MFQFTPTTGLLDTATYPATPANETAARQQFMDLFNQLRDEMNSGASSAIGIRAMSQQAVINGNFDVWQRGNSFPYSGTGIYCADRWKHDGVSTASSTVSRQPLTAGTIPNAYYHHRFSTGGAGTGYTSTSYSRTVQYIENGVRYLAGAGKRITVSFWARSSIANKKIGVYLEQSYGTGGSPSATEQINGKFFVLTSTWTKYTWSFTTNTLAGKTFGTNNDDALTLQFWYAWGSSFVNIMGDTVSETLIASGDIDIAQVQLCAGEVALPFQPRSFAEELQLCQRYYERFDNNNPASGRANLGTAVATTSTNYALPILFKTEKRVKPTLVQGGTFRFLPGGANSTITYSDGNNVSAQLSCSATGATTQQAAFVQSSDAGGWIAFDAEL